MAKIFKRTALQGTNCYKTKKKKIKNKNHSDPKLLNGYLYRPSYQVLYSRNSRNFVNKTNLN